MKIKEKLMSSMKFQSVRPDKPLSQDTFCHLNVSRCYMKFALYSNHNYMASLKVKTESLSIESLEREKKLKVEEH